MTNNHTEPMKVDACRIEFEDWARAQPNYSLFDECWRGWHGAMSVVYAKIAARLGCHPAMLMQEIDQLNERADSRPTADEYRQLKIAHDNVCMMYQRAAAKEVVQSHGADFEFFAKCNGYDVSKNQYGNYTDADTINARDAFNAGRRASPSPAEVSSEGLLTDKEIDRILDEAKVPELGDVPPEYDRQVARAIERALNQRMAGKDDHQAKDAALLTARDLIMRKLDDYWQTAEVVEKIDAALSTTKQENNNE